MNRALNTEMKQEFLKSAKSCLMNAERLLDEAQLLEFHGPPATKTYLSMVSQEECSKGFLLYLVSISAIPWSPLLLRVVRDHACKQLVGVVIDFLEEEDHEFFKRLKNHDFTIPQKILDAITILWYEKVVRWKLGNVVWEENIEYDHGTLAISDGKVDRGKQRALYVEISKTGSVTHEPTMINQQQADREYEKSRRFQSFLGGILDGSVMSTRQYEEIVEIFKSYFSRHI